MLQSGQLHGFTHFGHGGLGHHTGLGTPCAQHIAEMVLMQEVILNLFPDWSDAPDHGFGNFFLAVEAADAGAAAFGVDHLDCLVVTEKFVKFKHRADIRIARIRALHTGWIAGHLTRAFLHDFRVGIPQVDAVLVAF